MPDQPRVAALHATTVAMEPTARAFGSQWPAAEIVNLLDDALTAEREKTADLTEDLAERFVRLLSYAQQTGAAGVLVTCSAFGPAVERAQAELSLPIVKPNEGMFQQALDIGSTIGMVATFAPAVSTMTAEFEEQADRIGRRSTLRTVVVEGAMARLRAGDAAGHNRLVASAAMDLEGCDAIMLAHFSTSRAGFDVRAAVSAPVLTAPEAAVGKLKDLVNGTKLSPLVGGS